MKFLTPNRNGQRTRIVQVPASALTGSIPSAVTKKLECRSIKRRRQGTGDIPGVEKYLYRLKQQGRERQVDTHTVARCPSCSARRPAMLGYVPFGLSSTFLTLSASHMPDTVHHQPLQWLKYTPTRAGPLTASIWCYVTCQFARFS